MRFYAFDASDSFLHLFAFPIMIRSFCRDFSISPSRFPSFSVVISHFSVATSRFSVVWGSFGGVWESFGGCLTVVWGAFGGHSRVVWGSFWRCSGADSGVFGEEIAPRQLCAWQFGFRNTHTHTHIYIYIYIYTLHFGHVFRMSSWKSGRDISLRGPRASHLQSSSGGSHVGGPAAGWPVRRGPKAARGAGQATAGQSS